MIEIDTSGWNRSVAKLAASAGPGGSIRGALDEEWPFLVQAIVTFTPPFKTAALRGGDHTTDKAIGMAAVARDIRKTMKAFAPEEIRNASIAKIVRTGDIEAFDVVASRVRSGPMAGARGIHFSPDVHESQRNARGRVGGAGQNRRVLGPEASMLKKYIREVQSRVGYAKSGWLAALYLVGGNAPAWVSRHGAGGGGVIDDRSNADEPSITAVNRTPWANRFDEGQRVIQNAFISRGNALATKLATRLRLAAREAGFAA